MTSSCAPATSLPTLRRLLTPLVALLALGLLAGCATTSLSPAPVEQRTVEEQVRAPAAEETRGLQVYVLRNPAVVELRDSAAEAEARGDLDRAALLLERALRIESRDPELLQDMAEIRLAQGNWSQAESYARRSFDTGPRVGEICQRNWRTIALAMEREARFDEASNARQRLSNCQVEPPPRF